MNVRTMLKICVVLTLFLASNMAVFIKPAVTQAESELPTDYPLMYVYPEIVSVDKVGETFTISVTIFNLTDEVVDNPEWKQGEPFTVPLGNLYGFDIQFSWNPTVLKYVNHTVTVPVEDYPDVIDPSPYAGILHKPAMLIKNEVDEAGVPGAVSGTMYWLAYSSMSPAEPFNGNGTFFTMTFEVLCLRESPLEFTIHELSCSGGRRIYHKVRSGLFRPKGLPVASFTFWPDIAVVDKPVYFNASVSENVTAIDVYMWDFGDGTLINTTAPEAVYTYAAADVYTVSLKVVDMYGIESSVVTEQVRVSEYRDLAVDSVSLSVYRIRPNRTVRIMMRIDNLGETPENFTALAYYNCTSVNWEDITATNWVEIDKKDSVISSSSAISLDFLWNTTNVPKVEAYYYILVNVTGIPYSYERNTTDNFKISNPILVTEAIIHEPLVVDFDFGRLFLGALRRPVIRGEDTRVTITVKNNGTDVDTIIVTLYVNGTSEGSLETVLEPGETSSPLSWDATLEAGYYNITVEARVADVADLQEDYLRVIETPKLVIEYTPETPVVNQIVTLNASASLHQDPEGYITAYTWRIFAPKPDGSAVDPETTSPTKTLTGVVATYNSTTAGNWTILLEVTDSYGVNYDKKRGATYAYLSEIILTVSSAEEPEGPTALPFEYIVAIIVVLVIVIAVAVILYRRRAKT